MSEVNANYDEPWKEAIGEYFQQFLQFFFPTVHDIIDWSKPPKSLDKELQQITASSDSSLRLVDKLFQVWCKDNREAWILVHIEIQSQEESAFAKRMYIYNYRAFDLYERPVISLAILGDDRLNWRPNSYGYNLGGCEVSLRFPIAKLLDYAKRQDLESSTNPFAVILMAHLKTKATTGKPQDRELQKWQIVRGLYERGFERVDVIKLFQVIDRMMILPEEFKLRFNERIRVFEEERKMPLLSNMELDGIEKGTRQTLKESVVNLLQTRFGNLTESLLTEINTTDNISILQELLIDTVKVNSVAGFEKLLEQKKNSSNSNI